MNAGTYNFELQQGASFLLSFQWRTLVNNVATIVNITGYHIRWIFYPKDGNNASFEWSDQGVEPVFTVDIINKKFVLNVPNVITNDYTFTKASHELEIISSSGTVYRFLTGMCTLKERNG